MDFDPVRNTDSSHALNSKLIARVWCDAKFAMDVKTDPRVAIRAFLRDQQADEGLAEHLIGDLPDSPIVAPETRTPLHASSTWEAACPTIEETCATFGWSCPGDTVSTEPCQSMNTACQACDTNGGCPTVDDC